MIGPESVLRRSDEVRYRLVEGEAVMILQEAGEALVLNEVAARLCRKLVVAVVDEIKSGGREAQSFPIPAKSVGDMGVK